MIIKMYSDKGLDTEYVSADDIIKIEVYDEETEKLINNFSVGNPNKGGD